VDYDAATMWRLNHRLLTVVLDDCVRGLGDLGLEAKEFFVLAELDQLHHPAELAARLVIPRPSLTVYLRNLERAGLAQREIDPDDLRRHRITLTPTGAATRERALDLLATAFRARLGRLDATEQETLERLLRKILDE
jgi:DNA-binding MarR family transcriptional regulator